MLNGIINEYFKSISKTKHSKPKEWPEAADPCTRVEPTNGHSVNSWQMTHQGSAKIIVNSLHAAMPKLRHWRIKKTR